MDKDFQTSFIPKKPIIENRVVHARPVGFLTIISFFLFFSVAIASGGLYFYKKALTVNIAKMDKDLNLSKNRFEPKKITELKDLDTRLRAASTVLSKHVTISPIFELLQKVTMQTVRYTDFNYTIDDLNSKVTVKMKGQAVDYRSVALQSDIFTENKELIDPVFSNLVLDDKKGLVSFDLEFSLNSSFVNYKQALADEKLNPPSVDTSTIDELSIEQSKEPPSEPPIINEPTPN